MAAQQQEMIRVADLPEVTDAAGGCPKIFIAGGRGKLGKSALLRWTIDGMMERGKVPVIADADRTNATLTAFYGEARVRRPPTSEDEDVRGWLNSLADELIEKHIDGGGVMVLDAGGGDLSLKQWCRDLDLAKFLEEYGAEAVAIHCLGSDLDDLSYLRDLEEVFQPKKTLLVLNEGVIRGGASALLAFDTILKHKVFLEAVKRGARVVHMPKLACMPEVDRRRLSYQEAQEGVAGRGTEGDQRPLGPTMRQMVAMWRRQMTANFKDVAPWLS